MPGYIGYTPQFDPISLQEYLTVPTMVLNEYSKAEDVYNETATKAEALKALLGERNADNEAGWRIVDNYEKQLGDLTNTIANGVKEPETYRQAKNAFKYYRENMLPLESGIPAYQKELERYNSDPSMIGTRPVLENYIKNPLYKGYMLSGDKIYKDMVDQGKMAAADRSNINKSAPTGYLNQVFGYSPEEQQEYLNLVQSAIDGDELAIHKLQNSDKYSQLYKGLNAYMKDHDFDSLSNNDKFTALNRAISGQLYGMTGKNNFISDKQWARNAAFEDWKRKRNYIQSQKSQEGRNTNILSRRPATGTQTDEQKKLQKKVNEFRELVDYFKKVPGAWTETDDGEPVYQTNYQNASSVQRAGLGNSQLVNIYAPQSKIIKPADAQKQEWARKRKKFTKLASELSTEIDKKYPGAKLDFSLSVEPQLSPLGRQIGSHLTYDTNLDYYLDNIANLTSGYNYEVTPKQMSYMTKRVADNANIDGSEKNNTLIFNEDGSKIKNSTLRSRKVDKALREGKVTIYIGNDLQHHFNYDGHTYTVKEEAIDNELGSLYFGDRDVTDIEGNTIKAGNLRGLRNSGSYEAFVDGLYDWAEDVTYKIRQAVPASPETSAKFDDSFSDDIYYDEED